jgi:hypothetical protein
VNGHHGTDEFGYHPRTGSRRLTLARDGLFSQATSAHEPTTGLAVERLSEPKELGALVPESLATDSDHTAPAGEIFYYSLALHLDPDQAAAAIADLPVALILTRDMEHGPLPLSLLTVIPGAGGEGEAALHVFFAEHRSHAEWFHPDLP